MSQEISPQNPELTINPEGLENVIALAAQKLVEAGEADARAAACPPGALGNIEQVHYMGTAGILRQEVRLISTVLSMLASQPEGIDWEDPIQARVQS